MNKMNTIAGGSDLLSYYNEAYGSSNTGSANKLQNTLSNADYSQASEEQLYDVCKQFESYFVEQVIKQMEKMIPESDEDSTASKYMDYLVIHYIRNWQKMLLRVITERELALPKLSTSR